MMKRFLRLSGSSATTPRFHSRWPIPFSHGAVGIAAGLFLFMTTLTIATPPDWEELPPLPTPTGGFMAGTVGGNIVVLGGTNWEGGEKHWLSSVYQFSPDTMVWKKLEAMPVPLAYGVGGNVAESFVVLGASTGTAPWPGSVQVTAEQVIADQSAGLRQPAVLGTGGVLNGEFIMVGGTDDAANIKGLSRAVFAFDVKTKMLRPLADFPGPGLGVAAGAMMNDELFVFTGASWDTTTNGVLNQSDAYAFRPARNSWRKLRPFPFPVRGMTAVVLDERHLYLAGGYADDGFTDRAFVYDIIADTYRPAPALPYKAQVGLVKCGAYVYCLGGEDRMKHRSAAAFRIKASLLVQP